MCEDCAASKPGESDRTFSLLSWMKRSEQGEKDLRCSCCGVALESGFYSPYILLKTKSWDVLECIQKEKSEVGVGFELEEARTATQNKEEEARLAVEDASMDVFALRVEKKTDLERIIPIELINSSTTVESLPLDLSTISKQETMTIPSTEIDRSEIITSHENHSCVLLPAQDPCDVFSTDLKNIEAMKPPVEDLEERWLWKRDIAVAHFMMPEKKFLDLYVVKYQEMVPEILEALGGNLGEQKNLNFVCEKVGGDDS